MELPRGINKIIEEYCYYPRVFEKELYEKTVKILKDTNLWLIYDKYYIHSDNNKCNIKGWHCYYLNSYLGWEITAKRI